MDREKAIKMFLNEDTLFDPQERQVFIPDISEDPKEYHGIQICTLRVDDATIAADLAEDERLYGEEDGSLGVEDWARERIPAPAAMQVSDLGTFDFYGFSYSGKVEAKIERNKHDKSVDNEIRANVEDFVDRLQEEGALDRLISVSEFDKKLRQDSTSAPGM